MKGTITLFRRDGRQGRQRPVLGHAPGVAGLAHRGVRDQRYDEVLPVAQRIVRGLLEADPPIRSGDEQPPRAAFVDERLPKEPPALTTWNSNSPALSIRSQTEAAPKQPHQEGSSR